MCSHDRKHTHQQDLDGLIDVLKYFIQFVFSSPGILKAILLYVVNQNLNETQSPCSA